MEWRKLLAQIVSKMRKAVGIVQQPSKFLSKDADSEKN